MAVVPRVDAPAGSVRQAFSHCQAVQRCFNGHFLPSPGVGIHIRRQLIMLSTSEGKVVSISIAGDNTVADLFPSLLQPTAVAIDWLADRVYVASRNRVTAASSSGRLDLVLHLDLCVQFSQCVSVHACVCVRGGGGEVEGKRHAEE